MLRATPNIGDEVAVENTASGRLYLGLAPERVRIGFSGKKNDAAIKRAVKRGYDTNEGEWIAGVSVVAAPVLVRGDLIGCIACAAAMSVLTGNRMREAIARTRAAAREVELSLNKTS